MVRSVQSPHPRELPDTYPSQKTSQHNSPTTKQSMVPECLALVAGLALKPMVQAEVRCSSPSNHSTAKHFSRTTHPGSPDPQSNSTPASETPLDVSRSPRSSRASFHTSAHSRTT